MKKICCACLSFDRELFQLNKVSDGINIIYSLLQFGPDTFTEGFLKDESASWMVCWECNAAISNIKKFRDQICFALKQMRILTNDKFMEITTQSHLKTHPIPALDIETDVFVDCGENYDIKKEDILDTQECMDNYILTYRKDRVQSEEENSANLGNIISEEHKKITNRCDKSKSNPSDESIRDGIVPDDYDDGLCYDDLNKEKKLKKNGESNVNKKRKIKSRKSNQILCSECGMAFDNKGAKWKHIQIAHKDGHKCPTCGKVFSFKFNLQRHERTHAAPAPPIPCPTCSKLVSGARLALHVRTHAGRPGASCAPCSRPFVTRDTYQAHLRNSRAHAEGDIFRYPCQSCDKKYRSRGELRDHVAYKHDNQKQKCSVCEKYLATRRSLARHVRRAHEGVREGARDKMCDYCGLTFRDKKSLCEHIRRHTGARPLACALCPRAFRQRAALYEHMKRLHPKQNG